MKTTLTIALVSAALLAGCGGGGDSVAAPAASDAVPDSASASIAGMTAWLVSLVRDDAQAKEPLETSRFQPPTSDNGEPEGVPD